MFRFHHGIRRSTSVMSYHLQRYVHRNTSINERVVFRRVGHTDYDDVINIRKFKGDYLPSMYHQLLTNHRGYVAIIDGNMVAFFLAMVCDSSSTLQLKTARTSLEYEQKRILRIMVNEAIDDFKTGGIKRISIVVVDKQRRDKQVKAGSRQVIERERTQYWLSGITSDIHLTDTLNVRSMQINELSSIFQDVKQIAILFPDKRFVLQSGVFRLMHSNTVLPYMGNFYGVTSIWDTESSDVSPFLSFSFCYEADSRRYIYVDFYGPVCDVQRIRNHFIKHFTKHSSFLRGEFYVCISRPLDSDDNAVIDALDQLATQTIIVSSFKSYGLERPLENINN